MSDITLTVSRQPNNGSPYYLVEKPNGNTPKVKKEKKVTWRPKDGGAYPDGSFHLLGVGRYDEGAFPLTRIEMDTTAGTVSAKAKKVDSETDVLYTLWVLEKPADMTQTPLVYMAYSDTPAVHPLAPGERPSPPPKVIIDP